MAFGGFDIYAKVPMLSSHLSLTRIGYLEEVFYIVAYFKKHTYSEMVFDPTLLDINIDKSLKKIGTFSSTHGKNWS